MCMRRFLWRLGETNVLWDEGVEIRLVFIWGVNMNARRVKIRSDDNRYWSGDFSATIDIDGKSMNTMKLLTSSREALDILVDESGWYSFIIIQPLSYYIQWQTKSGHTLLTQSEIPGPDTPISGVKSAVPPPPTPLTFRFWSNEQSQNKNEVVIMTSEGTYLTRVEGKNNVNYIDSTNTISPSCVFTLIY